MSAHPSILEAVVLSLSIDEQSRRSHVELGLRSEDSQDPSTLDAGARAIPSVASTSATVEKCSNPSDTSLVSRRYGTVRSRGRDRVRTEGLYRGEATFAIADRVVEVAQKYEKAPAQIALAWLLNKPEITAPVVGVSKVTQLDQLVEAAEITLVGEDVSYLEELYQPLDNLLSIGTS